MLIKELATEPNRKHHCVVDEYMRIVNQDVRIPVDINFTSSF